MGANLRDGSYQNLDSKRGANPRESANLREGAKLNKYGIRYLKGFESQIQQDCILTVKSSVVNSSFLHRKMTKLGPRRIVIKVPSYA